MSDYTSSDIVFGIGVKCRQYTQSKVHHSIASVEELVSLFPGPLVTMVGVYIVHDLICPL